MADVNDVLERLISDPGFRRALSEDPEKALAGYDLTKADLEMLAAHVSDDPGARGGMEQRTSKSALAGLFGGGGSGWNESNFEFLREQAEDGDGGSQLEEEIAFAYKKIKFEEGETLAPLQQDSAVGDHEIEMDVYVGRSEPEAPSDLSAGDEPDEPFVSGWPSKIEGPSPKSGDDIQPALEVDGIVGSKTTEADDYLKVDLEDASKSSSETSPLGGIRDGTSNTMAVSEPTSGSKGDPLVGDLTPKGETEKSTPKILEAVADGKTAPGHEDEMEVFGVSFEAEDPGDHLAGTVDQQSSPKLSEAVTRGEVFPGHEEEIDVESWSWGATGSDDPDQPVITGRVYNDGDDSDGTEGGPARESKSGPAASAGLRSDGELVQDDDDGSGGIAPSGRGAEEGIEGTDVSTGSTSEPGDMGDDLPDDPPED